MRTAAVEMVLGVRIGRVGCAQLEAAEHRRDVEDLLRVRLVVRAGIPVIFWVLSGLIVAYGLYYGISGISSGIGLIVRASLELLFIYTPLGVVFVRIFCEVLVLLFRISDTLTEIKNGQDRQAR